MATAMQDGTGHSRHTFLIKYIRHDSDQRDYLLASENLTNMGVSLEAVNIGKQ